MTPSQVPSPPRPSDVRPPQEAKRGGALRTIVFTYLPFVLSALWTAIIVRLVIKDVRYAIPVLVLAVLWVIPLYFQHRRQRDMLMRGNVPDVLEAWHPMLERTPYPETMQPILIATAYAANGWTEAAREALGRARKGGAAWDASIEQRLTMQTLLEAFDGDRARALGSAKELLAIPVPSVGIFLRRRITSLRHGIAAVARAFNRKAEPGDRELLLAAAKASPLFFWAFSYAAAVIAIDEGNAFEARRLITGAPQWSPSSVFAEFQKELVTEIARLEAARATSSTNDTTTA